MEENTSWKPRLYFVPNQEPFCRGRRDHFSQDLSIQQKVMTSVIPPLSLSKKKNYLQKTLLLQHIHFCTFIHILSWLSGMSQIIVTWQKRCLGPLKSSLLKHVTIWISPGYLIKLPIWTDKMVKCGLSTPQWLCILIYLSFAKAAGLISTMSDLYILWQKTPLRAVLFSIFIDDLN